MPRRWELEIAPLLARLGFVRPDENPVAAEDEARLALTLADYSLAMPSPGSRICTFSASVPAGGVGQFSWVVFGPGIGVGSHLGEGGCWLLGWSAHCGNGGPVAYGSSNHVAFPSVVAAGSSSTTLRLDNREAAPVVTIFQGHDAGALPQMGLSFEVDPYTSRFHPMWWEGTRLGFAAITADDVLEVTIACAFPLLGQRSNR